MAQYTTNTGEGAQPHNPGMVEKVKAKAEGLMDKITGKHHTDTTTGVGAGGNQAGGYGGQLGGNSGYEGQQGNGGTDHQGHHHTLAEELQQPQQQPMGTQDNSCPGTVGMSTSDKIKNMLPGHHKAGPGTGYSNNY